jgi:hypothetical protein
MRYRFIGGIADNSIIDIEGDHPVYYAAVPSTKLSLKDEDVTAYLIPDTHVYHRYSVYDPMYSLVYSVYIWTKMNPMEALHHVLKEGYKVKNDTHGEIGGSESETGKVLQELGKLIPKINDVIEWDCPDCGKSMDTIGYAIIHLNDEARWTFEQIADYLETLDIDLEVKNVEFDII